MTFVKGKSGNPSGMSKPVADALKLARESAPRAIAVLIELMENSDDERTRLQAAESILNRSGLVAPKEPLVGYQLTPGSQTITMLPVAELLKLAGKTEGS